MDTLIFDVLNTTYGDANLDGFVDGADFVTWNANKFSNGGWAAGDFTCDGIIDGADFVMWNTYKFGTADTAPVATITKSAADEESGTASEPFEVDDERPVVPLPSSPPTAQFTVAKLNSYHRDSDADEAETEAIDLLFASLMRP